MPRATKPRESQNGAPETIPEPPESVTIELLLIEAQFLYQALSQGSFPTPQAKQLAANLQLKLEATLQE